MSSAHFPKRTYTPRPRKTGPRAGKPGSAADRPAANSAVKPAAGTAWEKQASWYDQLQGEGGDDFHTILILPAVLRQLALKRGERVLDVGCGQGVLGRVLAQKDIACVGVDASPTLIKAAQGRALPQECYVLGDARRLAAVLPGELFDHAALILSLQDLDPLEPVLSGVAALVKPGGRVVMVLTHPAFRIPRRTSWGFDDANGIQYRRIDGYMSPLAAPIRTHPGLPQDTSRTTTFHRPLATYLNACGRAGLAVVAAEELCSHRRGTKGPRFGAEDRAAKEFPVFLVLTARRCQPPCAGDA
jgi:SAM-dependent methyltransferase